MSSSWNMEQGPSFVPAYQVSGVPYILSNSSVTTSAVVKVTFSNVTRWVQIRNTGTNTLRVGFTEEGGKRNRDEKLFSAKSRNSCKRI